MKTNIMRSLTLLAIIAFVFVGCYDVPGSIYTPLDPDEENAKTPLISSVDKSYMFTDEVLTITGQKFSADTSENFVYFYEASDPVVGDTTVTVDSLTDDGTYNIVSNFKNINITTSGVNTIITTTIDANTTVDTATAATSISEYTTTDEDLLVLTSVQTVPDTVSGKTKMIRTVTSYNNINDWVCYSAKQGEVIEASETELKVIPPDIDVINSKITVHVQRAIAPAHWGYIDLMIRPE
jgi:hypothetical protein